MILIIAISLSCISALAYSLYNTRVRLSKFSILIPIQDQKVELEKALVKIKDETNQETKNLLTERDNLLSNKESVLKEVTSKIENMNEKFATISDEITKLESLQSELLLKQDLIECSFYNPRYILLSSEKYEDKLVSIKAKQKTLIQDKKAIRCDTKWTVSGSEKEGEKMTNQNIKLGLSSYNGQVDNVILTVSYKNISKAEEKIEKIKDSINKMMDANKCYVTHEYHKLKTEELYLAFEYEQKLYEEKEEQKRIKMQMQEEERDRRAIEKVKEEAEREEKEYLKELSKAQKDLAKAHAEERELFSQRIAELESKLVLIGEQKERALSMAQQTRRGHVYIISNIGSFGENVFKIGMTRRLDPQDRVDELGDASVPFEFDVHGMIYSEDAPALENQLHRLFGEHTVNKINSRKEFFKVSIHEIQKECTNYGLDVELTKIAEARDYRQSIDMKNNPYKKAA